MAASTQAPNAWRVLALLFAANLLNFFDRTLPAVVAEPIRREWGLNDFELGLISTSFVLMYAVAIRQRAHAKSPTIRPKRRCKH